MDFLYGIITGLGLALTALFLGGLMKLLWPQPPRWLRALYQSEPRRKKGSRTMNDVLKVLHPDELAALPKIIERLKQTDGESWAVGDLLERLLKEGNDE